MKYVMATPDFNRPPSVTRPSLVTMAILTISLFSGCFTSRNMLAFRQQDPMAGAPRLSSKGQLQLEDVVAHLNDNTHRIHSWRANNIRIQANNFPLSGSLAVEQGRHVRLMVSSPMGSEVDLGSNDERFWVWSRRMEPAFVTCKHENMEMARQSLGIPFEPDWLMQALGVSPIPTSGVTMEQDREHQQVRLIQPLVSAHGRPLRRVILVDLKKGNGVITEHSLYDYNSQRIAVAKLSRHHLDKASGAVLPKRVSLDWPQNQMHLSMDLGKIEVNPTSFSSQIWDMPELAGYEVVNLDSDLPTKQTISGVRLGAIEESLNDEPHKRPSHHDSTSGNDSADFAGFSRLSLDNDPDDETQPKDDDWSE